MTQTVFSFRMLHGLGVLRLNIRNGVVFGVRFHAVLQGTTVQLDCTIKALEVQNFAFLR